MRLNKQQLEAVSHDRGPLLIIAGAGTGKTTVITERIKHLITKGLASPSEILALTFTEKAAREMEERVDVVLPLGYTQMWISTFHSFCDRVLRSEALHIGLDPRFKLLTSSMATQLVRKNLFKFNLKYFRPLGNPTKFIGGMLQHFSRLQDEDVSPSDYARWVQTQKSKLKSKNNNSKFKIDREEVEKWKELAGAYKVYTELKIRSGYMDYGDLIANTLELFRKRKSILNSYQKQFKQVLVDEYQDTNIAQNELVKILAGREKNITVVADDSQSIYRFRGAAVSNILQFKKVYPKAKVVTLIRNYRSTQDILDSAYKLIQFNNPDTLESKLGIDKNLVAQKKRLKGGFGVELIYSDRVENEADLVARKIESLAKEYDYRDFAILVRANNHAEVFSRALSRHGVPYQFLGPGRLFRQPEIVDLVSYLRVLYDFDDSVSVHRLFSIESFGISARDLAKMGNYARKHNLSLYESAERVDKISVSNDTKSKVKKILELVDSHLKLLHRQTAGQILYYFLESTGLLAEMLDPKNAEAQKRAQNVSKFFDKLKTYETDNEDAGVRVVVDWIDLATELGESPAVTESDWTQVNAVNILTVHSSKGLEFPVVFLVNLVGQRFPTNKRREQIPISDKLIKEVLPEGDYHIQEERRLFYVGMTRAMDRLYFTAASYYGEGKRERRLSPFVFEALGDRISIDKLSGDSLLTGKSALEVFKNRPLKINRSLPDGRVEYLSYSRIQTFELCPLHYKLRYLLKVPTPPSAAQSFGVSIHESLRQLVKEGEPVPNRNYLKKLLRANWVSEGYSSKAYEERMYKRGVGYLVDYVGKVGSLKIKTKALEQSFVVKLSGGRKLKIGGKIDRVDELGGGRLEIIDYKTSARIPTQKQVDKDRQLDFYALAATSIDAFPFKQAFGSPQKVVLSLYFLDQQVKISTTRNLEQLEEARNYIFKVRERIENSDFRCSSNLLCRNCEYKLVCNID